MIHIVEDVASNNDCGIGSGIPGRNRIGIATITGRVIFGDVSEQISGNIDITAEIQKFVSRAGENVIQNLQDRSRGHSMTIGVNDVVMAFVTTKDVILDDQLSVGRRTSHNLDLLRDIIEPQNGGVLIFGKHIGEVRITNNQRSVVSVNHTTMSTGKRDIVNHGRAIDNPNRSVIVLSIFNIGECNLILGSA